MQYLDWSVQVIYFCVTNHPNLFCPQSQWIRNSDRAAQMAYLDRSLEVSNVGVTHAVWAGIIWKLLLLCLMQGWDHLHAGFSWDCPPEHLHAWLFFVSWASRIMVSWVLRGSIWTVSIPEPRGSWMAFSNLASEVMQSYFYMFHSWSRPARI